MRTALFCLLLVGCQAAPTKTADVQQCVMQAVGRTEQGYMVVNMACVARED